MTPMLQWTVGTAAERIFDLRIGPGLILVPSLTTMQVVARALQVRALAAGVCPEVVVEVSAQTVSRSGREEIARQVRERAIRCVVATKVWSTGVDIPEVSWVILDPACGAPTSVIQSAGRGSRPALGKSEFEILIPPGRHRARQVAALRSEGYSVPDLYLSSDFDRETTPSPTASMSPPSASPYPAQTRSLSLGQTLFLLMSFCGLLMLLADVCR